MGKYVKVTESLFYNIKSLLNAGATYPEVEKYYGVCYETASRIKKSENFTEYRNILAAIALKKKQEKEKAKPVTPSPVTAPVKPIAEQEPVERKQTVIVQTTWQMTQEMQETNKLLKEISNKLAFIVEQLA